MNINRTIHYCWFGGNPLPDSAKKCIESWKKYCPDYEIKEWNEFNFDVNICRYTKEAFENKKWAFLSDYARTYILYNYGGVYFDTDVELIKNIDLIIEKGPFMGLEKDYETNSNCLINTGLGIACFPGHPIYKEILDEYNSMSFYKEDGTLNLTTVCHYVTDIMKKHDLRNVGGIQCIKGIYVYPKEYFCPKDVDTHVLNITKNTVSIHHYDSSWGEWYDRLAVKRGERLVKFFGVKLGNKINGFIYFIQKYGIKGLLRKVYRK